MFHQELGPGGVGLAAQLQGHADEGVGLGTLAEGWPVEPRETPWVFPGSEWPQACAVGPGCAAPGVAWGGANHAGVASRTYIGQEGLPDLGLGDIPKRGVSSDVDLDHVEVCPGGFTKELEKVADVSPALRPSKDVEDPDSSGRGPRRHGVPDSRQRLRRSTRRHRHTGWQLGGWYRR